MDLNSESVTMTKVPALIRVNLMIENERNGFAFIELIPGLFESSGGR